MDTFFTSYFYLCLELVLETWDKTLLTHFLGVHDLNQIQLSASFQWSGLSNQRTLLLTENCLQFQKWCPDKGRGVVSMPICGIKVRNGLFSGNQAYSTASQDSWHVHVTLCWNPLTSAYLIFLLGQNLSSKQTASTDNMWPKSDNAKKCH